MQASGGQSPAPMGAGYPVYLPSATPYGRQGASWPSGTPGRERRVYSREGGTLGLVGGETGYGELRRPWARVPLTGLP